MEIDYQKMYENLTVLLEDICQFLSTSKLGNLSHRDKKLMESLITRSKVQLQDIEKLKISWSSNEDYVDMEGKKDDLNKTEDNVGKTIPDNPESPYAELSAKDASRDTKSGFMSMRRKLWLGFDTVKRVYGTIHNKWLLIYFSEKCIKPVDTFNLKHYEAKESDVNKNFSFELTSTLPDKKVYYFTALTHKDMLQWIAHINRCHDNIVLQSKDSDFIENNTVDIEAEEEEQYDVIDQDNQEEIYCEVDIKPQPPLNNNTIPQKTPVIGPDLRPPLPGRRPLIRGSSPIPPPPVRPISSDSDESYECIQNPKNECDDDETYAQFLPSKEKTQKSDPVPQVSSPISEKNDVKVVPAISVAVLNDKTVEGKKERERSVKDKIGRYEQSKDANEKKDSFSERRNSSFVYNMIKKANASTISNSTVTDADEVKDGAEETNKRTNSVATSPKILKSGNLELSPPILKPVPKLAIKTRNRNIPSIGKMNVLSHVNQMTEDR